MCRYTPNADKPGGFRSKPARVVLRDEQMIEATHQFRSENDKFVCVYTGDRGDGLDHRIPGKTVLYVDTAECVEGTHEDRDGEAMQAMREHEDRHEPRTRGEVGR